MNTEPYHRLTDAQKAQIRLFLLRPPSKLAQAVSATEFPREFDLHVYTAEPHPRYAPVKTYQNEPILSGRFFRIAHFSQPIFAALYFDHDRNGIFGQPRTVQSFRLSDFSLTKAEYDEFLSDLTDVIHSIDPSVQIEWDGMEFMASGPLVNTGTLTQ